MCFMFRVNETNIIPATQRMKYAYDSKGNYKLTIKLATKILKYDPMNLDAFYYRGSSYYTIKNYGLAKNDFGVFISKIPNNPHVRLLHGSCCMDIAHGITQKSSKTREAVKNVLDEAEIAIKDFNVVLKMIDEADEHEFGFKNDGRRKTKSEAKTEAENYLDFALKIKEMSVRALK